MSKMKKAVAVMLAATMAMGSTLTVFAADTGNGGTTGKGENEGHVDMELVNVILPTVPEEGSPFDYVTDPERLIQSTAGAKYKDYKFPDADTDTGVYFRVGETEFANTSETLKVINKSSCNVKITVTATATATDGGKDLALAADNNTSATAPLYLNLKVGQTDNAITTTSGVSVEKTIAGNADNFEVKYDGSEYAYMAKDSAYSWNALELSLNGAVYKGAVEAETTAPAVAVTWAFAKADTGDSVDEGDQVPYEENEAPKILSVSDFVKANPQDVVIKFSLGLGAKAVKANGATLYYGENKTAVKAGKYTVDMTNKTVTINGAWLSSNVTEDTTIYVALTKSGSEVKTVKATLSVKDELDGTEPEIVSITTYKPANKNNVVITFTLGDGDLAVDADGVTVYYGADKATANKDKCTVDMAAKTVTLDGTMGWLTKATADIPVYIVLTKGGEAVKELAGTITVK